MIKVKIARLLGYKLYQKNSPQDLKSFTEGLNNKNVSFRNAFFRSVCHGISLEINVIALWYVPVCKN